MNEKLIFESLFWIITNKDVPISMLDLKYVLLEDLEMELVKLKEGEPKIEAKGK